MKRFLVFSFEAYEECGGVNDLVGDTATLEEAMKLGQNETDWVWIESQSNPNFKPYWFIRRESAQILDTDTGDIWECRNRGERTTRDTKKPEYVATWDKRDGK